MVEGEDDGGGEGVLIGEWVGKEGVSECAPYEHSKGAAELKPSSCCDGAVIGVEV